MSGSTSDRQETSHINAHSASQTDPEEPKLQNRRLIVCCDGTWNVGDVDGQQLTNVGKIARCIDDVDTWKPKKEDAAKANDGTEVKKDEDEIHRPRNFAQIVYYQPGIGTGTGRFSNNLDAMTGRGLSKGIRAAYSFISLNWSGPKDEIVLIGFSRGAFTVRCVAQFIQEVGLLTKSGLRHLPKLFKIWRHLGPQDLMPETLSKNAVLLANRCKELREWGELVKENVQIEVCAVWDTVRAVLRRKYRTVCENMPENIKFGVQALALGEKRNLYKPMKWNKPPAESSQRFSQCWFAGNHSDVGGGNKDMTLANIALAWVIGQLTNKIQFNHSNLWAITTTRSWSKPSPSEDNSENFLDTCQVIATAPISSSLLRSNTSWLSLLMRAAGFAPRPREAGTEHYSVSFLDYLGIAKYGTFVAVSKEENDSELPNQLLSVATIQMDDNTVTPLKPSDENKFEGHILEKWAKHIICAHVNLKQARNEEETLSPEKDPDLYQARRNGELKRDALYKADIPICAILSAFHKLVQEHQEGKTEPLEDFFREFKQSGNEKKWYRKLQVRQKTEATFKFATRSLENLSITGAAESPLQHRELKAVGEDLVFTRDFPLLMGRAHEMPLSAPPSGIKGVVQKAKSKFKPKNDEIPPCQKCFEIWKQEVPPIST
ncbi:hypothetical protein ACEPPN_019177 [Leptodophora sp. 'Broadleaf-Isolate-01']